jgi:hypothetical protein
MPVSSRVLHLAVVIGLLVSLVIAHGLIARAGASIAVTPSATTVAQYDIVELTFSLPKTYSNPYDPAIIDARAVITTPSGAVEQAAAFWHETVTYADNGNDDFRVVPGSGVWKVRYAPRAPGVYQYRVEARDSAGVETSPAGSFTATASTNPGYVRVDPLRPTRFAFENGAVFLPRGSNLAWNQQLFEYAGHFAAFKQAKMNFARVWLPFPSGHFTLEWTGTKQISTIDTVAFPGLGRYSQDDAYKLDWLLEQARANGVYLQLCLTTHHNFINWSAENPYNPLLGGNALNFWTNAEARRYFSNYVRYIGARYGAYTSLAVVEYWNELDDAVTRPSTAVMRDWHQQMVDALHAASPRRPLTTTSFKAEGKSWNDPTGYDSFLSLPMLDVAQAHHYDHSANATNMVWGWGYEGRWANATFNRPYYLGEYGYMGEEAYPGSYGPKLNRLNHHSTWAPIMHGGTAGSAMLWRVNWYFFPPQDFRDNARRFGDWIESELPYLRQMDHVWGGEDLPGYWAGGYRKANRAALYFLNKAARWDVEDSAIADVSGATYALTGLVNGTYRVDYTDPMTGASKGSSTVTVSNGSLTLALPAFRRDLAVKVYNPLEGAGSPPPVTSNPTPTPTPTAAPPAATPTPTSTRPAGTATPPAATATATATAAPAGAQLAVVGTKQSSNTNPSTPATNLLDGKSWTRWETTWSRPAEAWFEFDLGAARQISRARWQLGAKDYAAAFTIQVRSGESDAWQTVATRSGGSVSGVWQEQAINRSARFVRFTFANPTNAGKLGGFSEVQLFGE